jgi:arabinose-5-phosphate isomerase
MVRSGDVIILISNSGETEEIVRLLPAFARLDAQIVALTAVADSSMANAARIVLDISVDREACPLNLAPTTSTLNTLVLGDALSVALMEARGFNMSDFAMTHPGGALGRRLLTYVKDQMRTNNLPFVAPDAPMQDAIMVMTEGRIGMALVGDASSLKGVITDGDLRRMIMNKVDIASVTAGEVANPKPLTIKGTTLMVDAEARMQESRVQCLVVTNDDGHVEGIIQIFE